MTKGKFPNRLREEMKRAGIGATELAKAVDTSRQNVHRHMDGDRRLTENWAALYAPVLGIAPERLIFGSEKRAEKAPKKATIGEPIHVPLVSWVSAGRLTSQEGVLPRNVRKTLIVSDLPKGDWIALEVEGDSMDRIAPDGSIIYVNRADKRLAKDAFYVISTDSGEATFKRFRPGPPDRLQPFSYNPDHETIPLDDEYFVVGRVRRVMVDL